MKVPLVNDRPNHGADHEQRPRGEGPFTATVLVDESLSGKTVLAVLRSVQPDLSWSQLRTRQQKGFVSLNGIVCLDEARRVQPGDKVVLSERPLAPPPQSSDVRIQFADANVVVVEKPSGMITQRRPEEAHWPAERKARQPSLEEAVNRLLHERRPSRGGVHSRGGQIRCVHRLDRETSGLLVFARNDRAERDLVQQFRRHDVHRVYWAIVTGHPVDETIVTHIARDRGDGRRGSTNNPKIGQRAVTHVRWLEDLGEYSLIECRLETGRTNQIRIHLAERGHLVCGDKKYDQPYAAEAIHDESGAPRLALHAAELGFIHPASGDDLTFQMPFPDDLERFYERLRRSGHSPATRPAPRGRT